MADRGPDQDWFASKEIWIEAIIAVIGLYVFIIQTITARNPFFHRDLAKDRNFVTCTLFGVFVGALLFSTTALLPTFMQNLLGYSALQSGYASMPRGGGSLISFLAVPVLVARLGPRPVLFAGLALCVLGLWQMAHFDLSMTAAPIMTSGVIQGMGVGLLFAPLNTLAYATLAPVHRTEATVVNTMARSLGSSLGISLVQATLTHNSAMVHARLAERISGGDPVIAATLPATMNPVTDSGLLALNGEVTRQAAMISYDGIFAWMALATILLVPLLFFMRRAPSTVMALEAHAD
jgi:DHA2 family multidrug resistance protein